MQTSTSQRSSSIRRSFLFLFSCLGFVFFNLFLLIQASTTSNLLLGSHLLQIHNKIDTKDEIGESSTSYGVTIVHCKEGNMDWLNDIPSSWNIKIYETCGQTISQQFSKPFQNAGSEECSAYLTTMIDEYDSLPDINVFIQSDVLLSHGKGRKIVGGKQLRAEHSPFERMKDLVRAVEDGMKSSQYLAFGPEMPVKRNIAKYQGKHTALYAKEIFDMMQIPYELEGTDVQARSGACFAVHKDRIRAHSLEQYKSLRDSVLQKNFQESKRQCSALEGTWHVLLGEEYIIPSNSTLDHLWAPLVEFVGGWRGNFKTVVEEKKKG